MRSLGQADEGHVTRLPERRLKVRAYQPILLWKVSQCVGRTGIIDIPPFDEQKQPVLLMAPCRAGNVHGSRVDIRGVQTSVWRCGANPQALRPIGAQPAAAQAFDVGEIRDGGRGFCRKFSFEAICSMIFPYDQR